MRSLGAFHPGLSHQGLELKPCLSEETAHPDLLARSRLLLGEPSIPKLRAGYPAGNDHPSTSRNYPSSCINMESDPGWGGLPFDLGLLCCLPGLDGVRQWFLDCFTSYTSFSFSLHMAELHLEGNFLHRLPSEISTLQHLKAIDLSRNQFHDFPEQLTTLPALETINLEENEIVGEWTKPIWPPHLPLSAVPF